jgi:hypothetical protein
LYQRFCTLRLMLLGGKSNRFGVGNLKNDSVSGAPVGTLDRSPGTDASLGTFFLLK